MTFLFRSDSLTGLRREAIARLDAENGGDRSLQGQRPGASSSSHLTKPEEPQTLNRVRIETRPDRFCLIFSSRHPICRTLRPN